MNFENNFSDSDRLQQLVDGELAAGEVRECLQGLDDNSTQWRSIACAFVEDQMFRKQFGKQFGKQLGDYVVQSDPIMSNQANPVVESATRSSRSILSSFAIAAGVLLVGLIGYLVGSEELFSFPSTSQTGSNQIAQSTTDRPTEEALRPADLRPEYRMQLLNADGESLGGEVDLYEYGDLNRLVGNDVSEPLTVEKMLPPSGLSAGLRQRLSRSGYEVNESTDYMSGRLDDGRAFVVPIRSIRFDRGH